MTRPARQRARDARASTGHGNGDALIAPGRAAGALLGLLGLLGLVSYRRQRAGGL
jgi:MYXO-CTERM domain-containing protein